VLNFLSLSDSAFLVLASRRYVSGCRREQGVAENWVSAIRALSFLLFLFQYTESIVEVVYLLYLISKLSSLLSLGKIQLGIIFISDGLRQDDWRWAFELGVAAARAGEAGEGSEAMSLDSGMEGVHPKSTRTVPQGRPWPPENPARVLDRALSEKIGKVAYVKVDPVSYMAALGSEGLSLDAAKAWISDLGGIRRAEGQATEQLASPRRERPGRREYPRRERSALSKD
jgi:hypothetical protein